MRPVTKKIRVQRLDCTEVTVLNFDGTRHDLTRSQVIELIAELSKSLHAMEINRETGNARAFS